MTDNSKPKPKPRGPGRPFQKGVSPNPGGRPKLVVEFQQALRDRCYDKAVNALEQCLDDEDGKVRISALREVFDRMFGKPTQPVSDPGGKPIGSDLLMALRKLAGEASE